jgi:hypothetical protein
MMAEQEAIERAVIGKRITAMSWLPVDADKDVFELESVTLEGGTKLNLSIWHANFKYRIVAGIKEGEHANA